ncbi:MAG: hypothetical protein CMA63_01495 [Euryarchaeota archaeon]|nr:hypothetical protein [Euryarchaeota archaeon]|tara:strand:- start:24744 stop:25772 length:1029 start_codon:yes stop_codon:yes gene_type:complete
MEVWLDSRNSIDSHLDAQTLFDRTLYSENIELPKGSYALKGDHLMMSSAIIGSRITIENQASQDKARSLIGSVEWLIVEFTDWAMIPIENMVAAIQQTPTKIAAVITQPEQAQGAAFALEKGVDALIIQPKKELMEAASIVKSQRLERVKERALPASDSPLQGVSTLTITSVEDGGIAERYCIDMTRLLSPGEGLLTGSIASSLVLIHGETLDSEFVPARPFRVNAGPPNAYVKMADGTTKYLAGLSTGDEVLLVSKNGTQRSATIGRLKIETRPMVLIKWLDGNNKEGCMFMQQAETVRVIGLDSVPLSITTVKPGDEILGWCDSEARHIGAPISSAVSER